jgi:hypothetical protein
MRRFRGARNVCWRLLHEWGGECQSGQFARAGTIAAPDVACAVTQAGYAARCAGMLLPQVRRICGCRVDEAPHLAQKTLLAGLTVLVFGLEIRGTLFWVSRC